MNILFIEMGPGWKYFSVSVLSLQNKSVMTPITNKHIPTFEGLPESCDDVSFLGNSGRT